MNSKELIGVVYKIVYRKPLTGPEQKALDEWRKQSIANERTYMYLTKSAGRPVRFREPYPLWMILLWCVISLVLGICLSGFWVQQRHEAKHPYAAPLVDSAWHRIDTYARARGMVASYNQLGRLTFRMASDSADLKKCPAAYKLGQVDSMATQIYKDLIGTWNTYLGMVITTITIQHEHASDPGGGAPDYVGSFHYSTSKIGDPYLRLKVGGAR